MQKITFVQVNYTSLGRGKNILVIRGSLLREYAYNSLRVNKIFNACPRELWQDKFHADKITLQPK